MYKSIKSIKSSELLIRSIGSIDQILLKLLQQPILRPHIIKVLSECPPLQNIEDAALAQGSKWVHLGTRTRLAPFTTHNFSTPSSDFTSVQLRQQVQTFSTGRFSQCSVMPRCSQWMPPAALVLRPMKRRARTCISWRLREEFMSLCVCASPCSCCPTQLLKRIALSDPGKLSHIQQLHCFFATFKQDFVILEWFLMAHILVF